MNGKKIMHQLKAGDNSGQKATIRAIVDVNGNPFMPDFFSQEYDLGMRVRDMGATNAGDISTCIKTTTGLGEVYAGTQTPHVVLSSKHERPVVLAVGHTQEEALKKAMAGDVNAPFGGFIGFNTPLTLDSARFLDKMFIEGVTAPEYEEGTVGMLTDTSKVKNHQNRFLVRTGALQSGDILFPEEQVQGLLGGYFIQQEREKPFNVLTDASVAGRGDISCLLEQQIADVQFACNAAPYLMSNLVFFVQDGAVAGLGDGCGSRVAAAQKARHHLEKSVYAAIAYDCQEKWERVLYGTPFEKEDFADLTQRISLTGFSDAFFPMVDGFIETTGLDRVHSEFGENEVEVNGEKLLLYDNNFNEEYAQALIPEIIVQPAGCMGDKHVFPIANAYGVTQVLTMSPKDHERYQSGEKVTGRRFFTHEVKS